MTQERYRDMALTAAEGVACLVSCVPAEEQADVCAILIGRLLTGRADPPQILNGARQWMTAFEAEAAVKRARLKEG